MQIEQNSKKPARSGAILTIMLSIFHSPISAGRDIEDSKLDPKLLLETPRPRTVRMGWPIRVQIIVCFCFFAIFALWFNDVIPSIKTATFADLGVPAFILVILAAMVSVAIARNLRDLRLLQYGNCVMGRVIDKMKVAGGRRRRILIAYQFAVGPGKPMIGRDNDYTDSYSINSPVFIFFDPERLERHVAICSTGWRVCTKEGRVLDP